MIKIKAYDTVEKKERKDIEALYFNDDGTLHYVKSRGNLYGPYRFKLEFEEVKDEFDELYGK